MHPAMTESSLILSVTKRFSVLDIAGVSSDNISSKEKGIALSTLKSNKTVEKEKSLKSSDNDNNNNKKNKEENKKKKESDSKPSSNSKSKATTVSREWTGELQIDNDRILTVGEECISKEELKSLLLAKGRGSSSAPFHLYDGFEPSGRMHIAQGVFKAMNVNKCTDEGTNSKFIFWVADWFALMNDKMGGDLQKIKIVGEYLIEVWKAAGMNLDHVEFKWASDEITNHANHYWPTMLDVARRFNITRIKKCCQIMGRLENSLTAAQILYPLMQCTDVFFLKADICQLGVDQRKVNMLAREYCDAANIKRKPIILSHHMLYGLKAGQEKMSKSDPDSAIFMEDTEEDVNRKIMNAYCPSVEDNDKVEKETSASDAGKESMHLTQDNLKNPCLDYIQYIILCPPGATFAVNNITYTEFPPIKEAFLNGTITEEQLKQALIRELNALLQPVRSHFTNNDRAKHLLEQVQKFKKESMTKKTNGQIRHLNLIASNMIQTNSHVVFAPFPSTKPTLEEASHTLSQLRLGLNTPTSKSIALYLPDWTARVCNKCDADIKVIDAYYQIFITSLIALDPTLMAQTTIIKQSAAILSDPSNYWISVINAGRHFTLASIMGSNIKDADNVGTVIGRLMKVADIMGLQPSSIAFPNNQDSTIEQTIIDRYYDEYLSSWIKPSMTIAQPHSLQLQLREDVAHKTENDEFYLLDDPKVHGKSKMKKAFCQPGNTQHCPPISMVWTFCKNSQCTISRAEDNGGNIIYTSQDQMEKDFESGALHPGDLKAAATSIMVGVLEIMSTAIKADSDTTKASKALKAFEKKMSKKSKKK